MAAEKDGRSLVLMYRVSAFRGESTGEFVSLELLAFFLFVFSKRVSFKTPKALNKYKIKAIGWSNKILPGKH